jgi:hypothetical protein
LACLETVLSELIPILAVTGPFAFALVVVRGLPHAARALMVLVAGLTAIVASNSERREACLEVLDKVTRQDSKPAPHLRQPRRSRRSPAHP